MIGAGAAWQTLLKKIREEIKVHTQALSLGQYKDYSEAKELSAKIAQLNWVIENARAILGDNDKSAAKNSIEDDYVE